MFIKFFIKKAIKIWQTQKLSTFLLVILGLSFSYFFGFDNLPLFLAFSAWFVFSWNTLPIAIIAIGFIISIPVLIFLELRDVANQISVYAYFSLVALVLLEVSKYLKVNLWLYRVQKWIADPSLDFFKEIRQEKEKNTLNSQEFNFSLENSEPEDTKQEKENPEFKIEFVNSAKPSLKSTQEKRQNSNHQGFKTLIQDARQGNLVLNNSKSLEKVSDSLLNNKSNKNTTDKNQLIKTAKTQNLEKIEAVKEQIKNQLKQQEILKIKNDNPAMDIAYSLVVLILNIIIFSFQKNTAFSKWFFSSDGFTSSQEILSFGFITDRFFNLLILNFGLDSLVVFNTVIQSFFLLLFYINYNLLKKIYILFYRIDPFSKFFLFLLNLVIIYNPFTLQKVLEGSFETLISQTLLFFLMQIILSFLITFTRTKTLYLKIFLQKSFFFSLVLLLITYFNFELMFLIIPILLLIFLYFFTKWLIKKFSKKQTESDFYIKDSPEQNEIVNIAFKIQFLILIFTFSIGSLFIFLNKTSTVSVRNNLFADLLLKYSPSFDAFFDLPLVFIGLKSYNFNYVPGLKQVWESQIISFSNITLIYTSIVLLCFALLVWIFIFHIFIKKRRLFLWLAFLLIFSVFVTTGSNWEGGFIVTFLLSFSNTNYLLLKNQSVWVLFFSLVCLLLVSKKIEKSYKYFVLGLLSFLAIFNLIPFFSLKNYTNTFTKPTALISELNQKCNQNNKKVLFYPIKQTILSSQTRYPDNPTVNFYLQNINCQVFLPENFIYRKSNNQLVLAPSDSESFLLNKALEDYSQSSKNERLDNLKISFLRNNIQFLFLDSSSKDIQLLVLNLILDGLEPVREGNLYLFEIN
jgi:hypothetical protein